MSISVLFVLAAFSTCVLAVDAEQAEILNYAHNDAYGHALYGFWGGVVLFGIIRKVWQLFYVSRVSKPRSDTESQGSKNAGSRAILPESMGYWSRTYLTTPSAIGTHRARLFYWCTIPTRIEALVVVAYWVLSLVFVSVGYVYYTGANASAVSGISKSSQQWKDFADRCAVLVMSNLPILWMFAGRNNIFLWATGWSFQTFNIFHHHIARVVILMTIGHAAAYTHLALNIHLESGVSLYSHDLGLTWFRWGIVAATAMGLFWLTSLSWIRKKAYDLFLVMHISLAIIVIIATFMHTKKVDGAFNAYLWPLVAIWSFDRLLRIVRIIACNLYVRSKKGALNVGSTVAAYDPKSDVITVKLHTSNFELFKPVPGQHCFIYQPTSLKFWENHPFTVGSWSSVGSSSSQNEHSPSSSFSEKDSRADSLAPALRLSNEKAKQGATAASDDTANELIFYIRPYDGWTRRLKSQCTKSSSGICHPHLLVEGPYGHTMPLHTFDTLVFFAGGTGVSAVLPYLKDHARRSQNGTTRTTDVRFAWSSRKAKAVHAICDKELTSMFSRSDFEMDVYLTEDPSAAGRDAQLAQSQFSRDKISEESVPSILATPVVYHKGRPDIKAIIDSAVQELAAGGRCAVFVCGPAEMADDARAAANVAMRNGARGLEYFEDSFGW